MSLPPLPDGYGSTRDSLHQVAYYAVSPARYEAVGLMGLRASPGGFATPEFEGKVIRVAGDTLIVEEGDLSASRTITTIRDAAEFCGVVYRVDWFEDFHDPLPPADPDTVLGIDSAAAVALGDWFLLGTEVLQRLNGLATAEEDPSETQLWPEHFDVASELGREDRGSRATYGASPGDRSHDEPYFYVAAWQPVDRSEPFWNDSAFNGAALGYRRLMSSPDPLDTALAFLLRGRELLAGD